jgi:serine/threonine protein kinase
MALEPMSGDMEKVINFTKENDWEFGEVEDQDEAKIAFEEDFIKYVIYKTLQGLRFLHHRKIVHRDVKSDNVLYNYKGEIKLADFGFAGALTVDLPHHTEVMGTLLYMAPEMCQNKPYDLAVDIWSLGIMCVELAHRMRPHDDEQPFPDDPI